jgi:hypothetical protein
VTYEATILFISHAAIDNEIALALKKSILPALQEPNGFNINEKTKTPIYASISVSVTEASNGTSTP